MLDAPAKPDWDLLFQTSSAQEGYFTTGQAAAAGYSTQLLFKHMRAGRVLRLRRGIYRLVHFPAGEHEDLVAAWLWSERVGIFSHQTALVLLGLSDNLPANLHLTLPASWRERRLRVPKGLVLHFAEVAEADRSWVGPVPITAPGRTLTDCLQASVAPDLMQQAVRQATHRGLLSSEDRQRLDASLNGLEGEALIIRPLRDAKDERVRAAALRVAEQHASAFEKLAK
jgi:predicted transcriptional regulator of viral defense system